MREWQLRSSHHSLGRHAECDRALERLTQQYGAYWTYGVAKAHSFRGERDLRKVPFELCDPILRRCMRAQVRIPAIVNALSEVVPPCGEL
jgi:hypothetical protein